MVQVQSSPLCSNHIYSDYSCEKTGLFPTADKFAAWKRFLEFRVFCGMLKLTNSNHADQSRIQGGPGGSAPSLTPRFFFKSCSFQAILREKPLFWANFGFRAPLGVKTPLGPHDQNTRSAPADTTAKTQKTLLKRKVPFQWNHGFTCLSAHLTRYCTMWGSAGLNRHNSPDALCSILQRVNCLASAPGALFLCLCLHRPLHAVCCRDNSVQWFWEEVSCV